MVGASKEQPVKADLLLTQELPNKIQKTFFFFWKNLRLISNAHKDHVLIRCDLKHANVK